MFATETEPLDLLVELTPRLAKRRFREEIYKAWDHKCVYCGAPATPPDHLIPKFRGGNGNFYNLAPSCRRCNANKGSELLEDWYQRQSFFCSDRLEKIVAWMNQDALDLTTGEIYARTWCPS